MKHFRFHLGYNKLFTVHICGASGGLTLFYNNDFDVNILLASNGIIDIELVIQENGTKRISDKWI